MTIVKHWQYRDERMAEAGRRELIVAAAREAFTSLGYDGTSFGGIATALGTSKAAVGYYFPTKDSFLEELLTPMLDELEEAVGETDDPRDQLAAYLDVLTRNHDLAVWMDTDPVLQAHPRYGGRLESINEAIVRALVGGSRRNADRIRALSTLGGVWRPVRTLSRRHIERYRDDILAAALAGTNS